MSHGPAFAHGKSSAPYFLHANPACSKAVGIRQQGEESAAARPEKLIRRVQWMRQRPMIARTVGNGKEKGYRTAPLSDEELASGKLDLRVFIDRGCVEVYVNDGHQVLSSYSFAAEGPRAA